MTPSPSATTHRYKTFTGAVPFNRDPPTTVAVQILQGIRPERPKNLSLTDELWGLNQRCWDQEPLLRPGISEVVRQLGRALTAGDGADVPTKFETVPNDRQNRMPSFQFVPSTSHDWKVYDMNRPVQRLQAGA